MGHGVEFLMLSLVLSSEILLDNPMFVIHRAKRSHPQQRGGPPDGEPGVGGRVSALCSLHQSYLIYPTTENTARSPLSSQIPLPFRFIPHVSCRDTGRH